MLDKTEQSDRAPNPNEKPENCYCSALPNGSGLCLPCYTRWLAGLPRPAEAPAPAIEYVASFAVTLAEKDMPVEQMTHWASFALTVQNPN